VAGQVNLMCAAKDWPETVLVQTRYRQKAKPAKALLSGGKLYFDFVEAHIRPTPGQVAAVYDEDGTVLGGGIIEEAL
jgi:tRNA-specific 2-thiouridylase